VTRFTLGKVSFFAILWLFLLFAFSCEATRDNETGKISPKDSLPGPEHDATTSNEYPDSIQKLFKQLLGKSSFHGSLMIFDKSGHEFSYSAGYANKQIGALNDTSTLFQIASVTKHITAWIVLRLIEEQKLALTDDVSTHLKQKFPYKGIRITNLLDQTSGLPDFTTLSDKFPSKGRGPTNDEIVDTYCRVAPPLKFSPGSQYEYSNINYIILSTIIENLTGKKFEDLVRENFKSATGSTGIFQSYEIKSDSTVIAKGYNATGEKYIPATEASTLIYQNRKGSGGLWTSASVLAKWYSHLFFENDKYLSTLKNAGQRGGNFKLGWFTGTSGKTFYIYNHGVFPGFNAWSAYVPDIESCVVILGNSNSDAETIGRALLRLMIKAQKE